MHQAPGTREAEIAKAILPIAFCTHNRHGRRLGEDVVSIPRGENENLMRNKLRALNWFGQTLSDDLWDFASKQCAFNPNCGKTTVHPVRPRLMQRRVGSSEFQLPFSPSRRYARRPLPVARERDPPGRKRGDVGGMWIPGSGH